MNATIMFKCSQCGNMTPGVFPVPPSSTPGREINLFMDCLHCDKPLVRTFKDRFHLLKAVETDKSETAIQATATEGDEPVLEVEKGGWFIGDKCIESAALYDKDEDYRGEAVKLDDNLWRCEYIHDDKKLTTGERTTLQDAMQFLLDYGKELLKTGGFIDAFASFQMFPPQGEREGVTV